MNLEPGQVIGGRYRIERTLGDGGMGVVYLANHQALGSRVAVKMLRLPEGEACEKAREQFLREARILTRLRHPGLPMVLDFFVEDRVQVLVMEYIEGRDLCRVVNEEGPLEVTRVLGWMTELCDILQYLHTHDPPVVFRDLKPSNVLLGGDGRVRLVDFGIAKEMAEGGGGTGTFARAGASSGYAPPEQYTARSDASSDLYALGATVWSLLSARTPPCSLELLTGGATLADLATVRADVPREVRDLVRQLMALRPSERPRSASEVRSRVAALVAAGAEDGAGLAMSPSSPAGVGEPGASGIAGGASLSGKAPPLRSTGTRAFSEAATAPALSYPARYLLVVLLCLTLLVPLAVRWRHRWSSREVVRVGPSGVPSSLVVPAASPSAIVLLDPSPSAGVASPRPVVPGTPSPGGPAVHVASPSPAASRVPPATRPPERVPRPSRTVVATSIPAGPGPTIRVTPSPAAVSGGPLLLPGEGAGRIRLGTSLDDLRGRITGPRLEAGYEIYEAPEVGILVASRGRVLALACRSGSTPGGSGIGSPRAQVEAEFGRSCRWAHRGQVLDVYFASRGIGFRLRNGVVMMVYVLPPDALPAWNGWPGLQKN